MNIFKYYWLLFWSLFQPPTQHNYVTTSSRPIRSARIINSKSEYYGYRFSNGYWYDDSNNIVDEVLLEVLNDTILDPYMGSIIYDNIETVAETDYVEPSYTENVATQTDFESPNYVDYNVDSGITDSNNGFDIGSSSDSGSSYSDSSDSGSSGDW